MKPRFRLATKAAVLTVVFSTACASMPPSADAPSLDGTAWVLASLPGRALLGGATVTLQFEGGRASGSDGCNRYVSGYSATGGKLKFDASPASTMMACAPDVMEQARAYTASLGAAGGYRIDSGQLQLLGPQGAVVASFSPQSQELAGTAWDVTGYNNGKQAVVSVLGGTQLTMEFAPDGRVSGSAGCNRYTGTYSGSAGALKFGPAATTRKMCAEPEGIMDQEQQFLRALETVATVRREGDRAELRTADGALALNLQRGSSR